MSEYLVKSQQLGEISIFFIHCKNEDLVTQSSSVLLNLLATEDSDIMDTLLEPEHNVINFLAQIFKQL